MSQNEDNERRQPRQPADLQGLLRFAMETTRNEDTSSNAGLQPMDNERKQFLEDAINSLSVDVTKELQDNIKILSNKENISRILIGSEVPENILNAFDTIETHISCIDTAIGFYKLEGFSVFPICLSCEHPIVRSLTHNLLAEICQNNPYCQSKALECGYLQMLITMLNDEQDIHVLIKILYAISCIIRHHEPCTNTFLNENNSYIGLKSALEKPSSQLKAKAAFLISCLFPDHKYMSDKLKNMGVLKALIHSLPKERDDYSEQILCALHVITNNSKRLIIELNKPEYNSEKILTRYVENNNLSSENTDYIEEKMYCQEILNKLKFTVL